jgi:hypothetical protein
MACNRDIFTFTFTPPPKNCAQRYLRSSLVQRFIAFWRFFTFVVSGVWKMVSSLIEGSTLTDVGLKEMFEAEV